MTKLRKFLHHLNFRQEARELGLPLWESPSFLFLVMGLLTIIVMVATYFLANVYEEPSLVVGAVSVVTVFILTIGTVIIRSVERIAEASKMKSEFISVASHELRTPLSAIKWAIDLLVTYRKSAFNQEQLEYLNLINDNNEKLIKLTSNLLDVSRIESGTIQLKPEKGSIINLMREALERFGALAKTSNVALGFTEPVEEIPLFYFDQDRIQLVIDNLINNAIKYIKGTGNVDISLELKRKQVVVRIKDTGVGIPEHDQPLIFNKFYRSSNTMIYQTQGAGLGLFMAKSFVEASGGRMGFESEEEAGSTFWFSLPIK